MPKHEPLDSMKKHIARAFAGSLLAAAVHAAWAAEPGAPADSAETGIVRFDISRFDVSGNTLLSQAQVDAAVAPFTGRARDFGHVQQALEALEAAYHARGYQVVKVQLPEQELNGGVVRLVVQQTRVGKVTVSGNRHFSEENVRRSLPGLAEGATPNLDQISASLRLANESPAKQVQLKLQSGEQDDAVDARLDVRDQSPWRASLNLDNGGTEATGKTYTGVVLQHANLWGRDHVASIQYTTTAEEPGKVAVWGAGYHIPLYALGDSIDLFASHSNIDSGSVTAGLFNLTVNGKGSVAGLRYNQVLARRGERDARLVYGLDVKAFKNNVLFAGQNFGNDVTVRPLSLAYTLGMPLDAGTANLSLTLLRNLPGGSRGGADDFTRARTGAKDNYTILRFAAAYARAIGADWQARLLLNGQLTGDALVPGEQFGAGGGATVRGLDERTLSADAGAVANAELYSPSLCASSRWQCRVVGFVDAAHGRRHHALPGELRRASLASAGLGLRVTMGQSFNLQADFGHVLNDGAIPGAGKHKLHVRLGLSY
jgi:hemolysin activation/secretion protein